MTRLGKLALATVAASVLLVVGGCAGRYHDDYYDNGYDNGYYDNGSSYRDGEHWRDRHRRDDWRDRRDDWRDRSDNDKRVRVCDADGSDCHWEYRER